MITMLVAHVNQFSFQSTYDCSKQVGMFHTAFIVKWHTCKQCSI